MSFNFNKNGTMEFLFDVPHLPKYTPETLVTLIYNEIPDVYYHYSSAKQDLLKDLYESLEPDIYDTWIGLNAATVVKSTDFHDKYTVGYYINTVAKITCRATVYGDQSKRVEVVITVHNDLLSDLLQEKLTHTITFYNSMQKRLTRDSEHFDDLIDVISLLLDVDMRINLSTVLNNAVGETPTTPEALIGELYKLL